MEIGRVYAVYFSATGTTEKVVCQAADAAVRTVFPQNMEESEAPVRVCFNSPEFRRKELSFSEGELVFFGIPVYAGRVPNLLLPYLKEKVKGGGAVAVPVVLYGNRNFDDALKELVQLLEEDGFLTAAAGSFVGEHAFPAFSAQAGRIRRIWLWRSAWERKRRRRLCPAHGRRILIFRRMYREMSRYARIIRPATGKEIPSIF